jgi:hypothetical protein
MALPVVVRVSAWAASATVSPSMRGMPPGSITYPPVTDRSGLDRLLPGYT